jgi:hypothetical protein
MFGCRLKRLGDVAADELDVHSKIIEESIELSDKAAAGLRKARATERKIMKS